MRIKHVYEERHYNYAETSLLSEHMEIKRTTEKIKPEEKPRVVVEKKKQPPKISE